MLLKIRCKYLIEIIFNHLKNKKKLNILKYNKTFLSKINITKEDFKVYDSLKEFNHRFNVEIKDIDITELDLSDINIGNIGLKYLKEMKFKYLKILDLSNEKESEGKERINNKKLSSKLISDNI